MALALRSSLQTSMPSAAASTSYMPTMLGRGLRSSSGVLSHVGAQRKTPNVRIATRGRSRSACVVKAVFDNKNDKDIGDRIIASLAYLLPLLDAIPYGKCVSQPQTLPLQAS